MNSKFLESFKNIHNIRIQNITNQLNFDIENLLKNLFINLIKCTQIYSKDKFGNNKSTFQKSKRCKLSWLEVVDIFI